MTASMMALPQKGHLIQEYHIFTYLKRKHNVEMVFDPSDPHIDDDMFPKYDWSHTAYCDSVEVIPKNALKLKGMGFKIVAFVDSDHAGDTVTRKSRTEFLINLNSAPIYWLSKNQSGIETSSFRSEFTAMKHCCKFIRTLSKELQMMGEFVNGPAYIFGDNKSVLSNGSIPDSVLRKKSNSTANHFMREAPPQMNGVCHTLE